MQPDMERVERIIDFQKVDLASIYDGVIEGTLEGVKEGVVDGSKKGVKDGIRDCILKGFENIEVEGIEEILEDIPETTIKTSMREGTRYIFKKSIEGYLQRITKSIMVEIQKRGIKLDKDQTGHILEIVKRSHHEAIGKALDRLPDNPFFKETIAGIQTALEESLAEEFSIYEEQLQREIANQS